MISQTKHWVDELISILENLVVIYRSLKILGEEKKKVLALDDLTSLRKIAIQEEEMTSLIATFEERRLTLQKIIPGSPTSFNQLIILLEEPNKSRVTALYQELRQLVGELRLITDTNSFIVQHLRNFLIHKRNVLLGVSTMPSYEVSSNSGNFADKKGFIDKII
jgi:hypothetical protein